VTGITGLYYDILPGTLNWNTYYYWRVNARNSYGTSGWSGFRYFRTPAPRLFSLTVSSTVGGSVPDPGEGAFTYDYRDVVELVATPGAGYRFDEWAGDVGTIADVNSATTNITMYGDYSITANFVKTYDLTTSSTAGGWVTAPGEGTFAYDEGTVVDLVATTADAMVDGGGYHTVGLKSDGTVVAVGSNDYGQSNVSNWTDIVQVSGGCEHTVGLKFDGTVVAAGDPGRGECNVSSWTDIIQVSAGGYHNVGLKPDGTVVAVGVKYEGQCDVSNWTDIIEVSGGYEHTVGLRSDGTVVAVGRNHWGQCDVGSWTGIVQVAAGMGHTVGLKADGTVVAMGYNFHGECNVGNWTDIVQVSGGECHTVGLKSDGTVVAVGQNAAGECNVGDWTDIVQIAADGRHTVGLKSDGTVVAVGGNGYGQCNVGSWRLFTHRFVNWTGNVGTIADVNAASTTITMSSDYFITANFMAVYDLTISTTAGGSVTTPGVGNFTYDAGTVVNLVATPDEGYRFDEWTGDVGTIANVTAATTNITMNGDYSITANFVKTYDLTTSSTGRGDVTTPGEGTFTYDEGTVVDLVATREGGYSFVNWTGDVGTIADVNAASTNITMNGDYSITANFTSGF